MTFEYLPLSHVEKQQSCNYMGLIKLVTLLDSDLIRILIQKQDFINTQLTCNYQYKIGDPKHRIAAPIPIAVQE